MIPFSVFQEAGLDLLSCKIIDEGKAETLNEAANGFWTSQGHGVQMVERHFTGARLFKAALKLHPIDLYPENKVSPYKYFLCDIDRREIEHNIINFFLAELPEKCRTIEEAYLMLKPDEVKNYEDITGEKVARQGEFFFIPVSFNFGINEAREIREIRVGNSRPNRVEIGLEIKGAFYVTGRISHTGREHKDLVLPLSQWFKVVPNTSKANFQLTGDID
jgi:hypothetical protein